MFQEIYSKSLKKDKVKMKEYPGNLSKIKERTF